MCGTIPIGGFFGILVLLLLRAEPYGKHERHGNYGVGGHETCTGAAAALVLRPSAECVVTRPERGS